MTNGGIIGYSFEEVELEDEYDEEEFEEDEEEDRGTDDIGADNFNDYEDFVYQNTSLSKEQAREVAREGWLISMTLLRSSTPSEVDMSNCLELLVESDDTDIDVV